MSGVIGDPVSHSLSPVLHNAAYGAMGLDWVYVALKVARGRGTDAVRAVATLGLAGLSVTMPHKADAASAVDRLTPRAARLGAVNTVVPTADGLVGDNTDGAGFIDSLRDAGRDAAGTVVVLIGTGGAARAVAVALADAGADSVSIIGRDRGRAGAVADLAQGIGSVVSPEGVAEAVTRADLVVNATPLGMSGVEPAALAVPPGSLRAGQTVVDLVYEPMTTRLLIEADRVGATAVSGLGMLVHQAARQITAWAGIEPPIDVMESAARRVLDPPTDQQ